MGRHTRKERAGLRCPEAPRDPRRRAAAEQVRSRREVRVEGPGIYNVGSNDDPKVVIGGIVVRKDDGTRTKEVHIGPLGVTVRKVPREGAPPPALAAQQEAGGAAAELEGGVAVPVRVGDQLHREAVAESE